LIEVGILLASLVALMTGLKSVYQRVNAVETDEFITAWASRFFGIPILIAGIMFRGIPELSPNFFLIAFPYGFVVALASIMIAKAYKASDASIVTPMFALSPALVLITSFLALGETPDLLGVTGVLTIALGAYLLKAKEAENYLEPFKKLMQEKGVQIILAVILLYSATAVVDKIMVEMSSPVMWPLTTYTLSSMIMMPIMMKKSSNWKKEIKTDLKPLLLLGGLSGASIILQMAALEQTLVSYVISIKRLSIPITVILSYIILKEKEEFKQRITGATIMMIGALLIYI
jgi:Predicted membrane protein